MPFRPAFPDKDAIYGDSFEYTVDHLPPQLISPDNGGTIFSVAEIAGLAIEQVIVGSCANGRFEDLRIAADILKGKKVHSDVRMLIYPGSRAIYLEALTDNRNRSASTVRSTFTKCGGNLGQTGSVSHSFDRVGERGGAGLGHADTSGAGMDSEAAATQTIAAAPWMVK